MVNELFKQPPHSIEAEQSLLGGLLLDNRAWERVADLVSVDDFYRDDHRRIFRHIGKLIEANRPADVVTVLESIEGSEDKDKTGGVAYLGSLSQNTPSALNIRRYAELVREKALLRGVITAGAELQEQAFAPGCEASAIVGAAEDRLLALIDRGARDYQPLRQVLAQVMESVDAAYHRGGAISGTPTGFVDLDAMTGGMEPGNLIIVAARTSMGKTTLAQNIVEYVAANAGPVFVAQLEMQAVELGVRALAGRLRISGTALRNGQLSDEDWSRLSGAMGELHDLPIFIDDTPAITLTHLKARARRVQRHENGLALIVVDYLQLMRSEGRTREQEVSAISRGLKALAKDLNVPVLALCQLNRATESRTDKRPHLHDLRESGAIEQDADIVLMLYRDDADGDTTANTGLCQVLVRKNRNGARGEVTLAYLPEFCRFENTSNRFSYGSPVRAVARPRGPISDRGAARDVTGERSAS